jgi:type I restriction enzyme S subunit
MTELHNLITDNIDIWTSAIKKRSATGRGSSKKIELTGIKKLRDLILELAVRGKLVPQDPNDEPARGLLKEIGEEKAKLIKDGKIKKQKTMPLITDDEKPFELPKGWEWTCLGQISEIAPRNNLDDDMQVGFVPMPLVSTSYKGDHEQELRIWSEIKKGYTHFADGDIGLAKITPCFENSKAAVFKGLKNGFGAGTTELHIARPIPSTINPLFVLLYLKAPMFLEKGKTKMTGSAGQKRIPSNFFSGNPLPFAPIKEQHRIVAKVDELMALCDQLEHQTEQSISAHKTLVQVLLNTLTASSDAQEFNQNWARIAEHFDTIFITEDSIEQLKDTIFQLAVMGKLVSQDTNNEPASELLKKIAVEKAQLIAEKKITKQKSLPEISEADRPFILPIGWSWSRLGNIYDLQYGNNLPKDKRSETGEYPVYGSNGVVGSHNECCIPDPCIVIGRKGSAGALNLCRFDGCWVTDVAYSVTPSRYLDIDFVFKSLHTFGLDSLGKGIKPGLNRNEAYNVVIAIPPFEEQKRISAKTEELFELCEQIRNQISNNQMVKVKLAETFVKQSLSH